MKAKPSKHLELCRVRDGNLASDQTYGNNGAFEITYDGRILFAIASSEGGWDHVSVRTVERNATTCGCFREQERIPTWDEMDYVRKLFFRGDEWVVQYHAPTSKHVNNHPCVLHMWRPQNDIVPIPPEWMV